jgi:hypothetical protein
MKLPSEGKNILHKEFSGEEHSGKQKIDVESVTKSFPIKFFMSEEYSGEEFFE